MKFQLIFLFWKDLLPNHEKIIEQKRGEFPKSSTDWAMEHNIKRRGEERRGRDVINIVLF